MIYIHKVFSTYFKNGENIMRRNYSKQRQNLMFLTEYKSDFSHLT
jgi:hypothetical protein